MEGKTAAPFFNIESAQSCRQKRFLALLGGLVFSLSRSHI